VTGGRAATDGAAVDGAAVASGDPAAGEATTDDGIDAGDARSADDAPVVSVVVPTYGRRPDLLGEAIESVAAQTYEPIELLVVDDSPSGAGAEVARSVSGIESVRCLTGSERGGAAAARNVGIRASTGSFLAFLDDDDRWRPEKLARQVAAFREAPDDVGAVLTGQRYVVDGTPRSQRAPEVSGDVTADLLRGASLCPFSTAMVRASLVRDGGVLLDERLPCWEDREWYLRLSLYCTFRTIEEPLVDRGMGDHEQLTDDFERIRDEAYPLFVGKHRRLATALGLERQFVAAVTRSLIAAALGSGRYGDARRAARRAIRNDPRSVRDPLVVVALGGRWAHRGARAVRRVVAD